MGLLGGDVSAVAPTSADWKDLCHTYLNAQLIESYHQYIKTQYSTAVPPDHIHGLSSRASANSLPSLEETVAQVVDDRAVRSKLSTQASLSAIQISVISDTLTRLILAQGALLASDATGDRVGDRQ